jgi:arginase family enzyme
MDRLFVAAFEGTSRIAGVALGALRLLSALREAAQTDAVAGREGRPLGTHDLESPRIVRELTKNSAMWCRKLHAVAEAGDVKLTLGGEHLVTFPILESLVKRHPRLRLVVLDAHHDAYPHPLLTHWSLFHFAVRELKIPTLIVGVRHEIEKADRECELMSRTELGAMGTEAALARIVAFAADAPLYFSVDVDVLDPTELAAVSDPVPGGISLEELVALTRGVLARDPIAADIVEYNALRDPVGIA